MTGVASAKEKEAVRWFEDGVTVRDKSRPGDTGIVTHVYYNGLNQLCCHVKDWNGRISGYRFEQLELDQ